MGLQGKGKRSVRLQGHRVLGIHAERVRDMAADRVIEPAAVQTHRNVPGRSDVVSRTYPVVPVYTCSALLILGPLFTAFIRLMGPTAASKQGLDGGDCC